MEAIKTFWSRTMEIQEARWFIAFIGLVVCLIIAYYFIVLFRNMAIGESTHPTDYITEFQRLRDEGELNDEEYTRLAQAIPKHMHQESDEPSKHTD